MSDYVDNFLNDFDKKQLLEDAASEILSQVCENLIWIRLSLTQAIVKCLNTDAKIRACYSTGAGIVVPDQYVQEAKEVCQGWITNQKSLLIIFGPYVIHI